jgi:N-acyl amino acid synthase of PEP-CTERM/exosortase system
MSRDHGITHLCAVMEPALMRLLARFGLLFRPYGERVDYHGLRQPCYCDLSSLDNDVRTHRADYWDIVTSGGQFRALDGDFKDDGDPKDGDGRK